MVDADGPTFGDVLRPHRLAAHLTQEELADRAQLSRRAIQELERGARRRPRRETVRALADALLLDPPARASLEVAAQLARTPDPNGLPPLNATRRELPVPLTNFIGRERELAQVRGQLRAVRLLTLTGPGGIGKTRLAVEVVQACMTADPDGVEFVDLAPLAEPSQVPQAVAASLGIREQPGHPSVETLMVAVRGRRLLLVLDNCEHLLGVCAGLAEALLRGCPQLSLLTTSREALGVPGEVVFPVPPLSLPGPESPIEPERILQSEAVLLFVDRATAARAGFALGSHNAPAVAQICQRLDGIPLAIELAAARVKVLSAEQIADHLADRFALLTSGPRTAPARHQSLSAAVAWSYDLLEPMERTLFDRLSVFAGGWTLKACEAICRDALSGIRQEEVLDRLTRLIDSSLVIMEERDGAARYRQLETLRAFGCERLETSGEAQAVRGHHAAYYLGLAEAVAPQADGPEHLTWLRRLEAEYDNVRAALAWFAVRDAARGLRLTVAVARYWYLRGFVTEGCRWLEELLLGAPDRTTLWARAALGLANLLDLRHDQVLARRYAEESLVILRTAGAPGGAAQAARFLGLRAFEAGNAEEARTLCQESLALARQASDQRATVEALGNLGLLAIAEQDLPEARHRFEESLALARAIGFRFGDVKGLARLGVVTRLEGDYVGARALIAKGLALAEAFGHRPATCTYLTSLGNLARCEGDYAEARRLLRASLQLGQRDVGLPLVLLNSLGSLGVLAVEQTAYGPGVRLLAAVTAGGAPRGTVQFPELRYDSEAALAAARTAMGELAFAAAWTEGQAWSLDEAIRQALAATEPSPALVRQTHISVRQGPPPAFAGQPANAIATGPPPTLTPRQRGVATLVAQGRTNHQIGEALVITEGTARVHVEHILAKLGLHSRAQLAVWAVARGLHSPST